MRSDSLYFTTNIFKVNDSDHMLLTPNGHIQALGDKFMKILGEEAINVPLSMLFEVPSSMY